MSTPAELREQAATADRARQESWDRSDTDGFVSQWASGLTANKLRLEAEVIENDRVWQFPALFDLDGNRARAKLHNGGYGPCWMFCDSNDRPTGKFITAFPARESTMAKKGYREGMEDAPAKAEIMGGSGTGLAGAASCLLYTSDAADE